MEISIQSLYKEISVLGLRDGWLDVAMEKFGSSIKRLPDFSRQGTNPHFKIKSPNW